MARTTTAFPSSTVSASSAARPSGRRRGVLASLAAAVLTLAASALTLVPSGAPPAHAASSLNQVTGFGADPGNLAMYSYVPQGLAQGAPLVVALHGCTQTATDYYDHSGWSHFADQWGFAVVFPQTSSANNALSCFNWFDSAKDTRGNGEAESVAEMVSYAESHYGSDPHRVYVTGLSAGAGLTADLLADYPDVFAGGAIDSGLPAQCATTETAASSCQTSSQNLTPAQWGNLARNSDPGYTGPWPRVAIWQGTADYTVYPVNATELRDQWTNVWGISQTASSTQTLSGGTTESVYNDANGNPAVELYSISGMGHGLAVDPGSGTAQCGSTGAYFLSYICSTYYTATFWGLNSGTTPPTTTPSTTPSTPPTSSSSSAPAECFTASNYDQTVAGRAYVAAGLTYADGSNQAMGLWNVLVTHTLKQTSPGYYVIADSGC
ncbi:PHB depolymerase family esterase [Catenulispora sp. NF23]|uniref:extracellular catalytic domain type 1 short-chain-length polyhydroxyalkanoate depolymerase n=1 Tax=Catenulispora pinistramenti TaxID=2705254 RepID=UPI001BA7B993|nr:PHB depolymerase family esterase [Catenulispora pinistramenti]MBS2537716.1 PHB depolymerase family esterase [Catenulispora pinistramenti]